MTNEEWDKLVRDLEDNRCILMLGPRFGGYSNNGKWYPLIEAFSCQLAEELKEHNIEFDATEKSNLPYIAQLYLRIKNSRRIDLEYKVKDFIELHTKQIPPIYNQLANLPFQLIVNTSLDNYIERAINRSGKNGLEYHYNFKKENKQSIDPDQISATTPLIFNLFGSTKDTRSLVLTDEDQLAFLKNVVQKNPSIPAEIMEWFEPDGTYLFLGFNVEHWKFRLLLESLKLSESNATYSPISQKYPVKSTTKNAFEGLFNFHFITQNLETFVSELAKKYITKTSTTKLLPLRKVFIAFHQNDEAIFEGIDIHASPMKDRNELELLDRRQISPGQSIDSTLQQLMSEAYAIVLFLSADFLADDGIRQREFKWAFELAKKNNILVIPVIIRPCDWESVEELKGNIPIFSNDVPLKRPNWEDNSDQIYTEFLKQLKNRLW